MSVGNDGMVEIISLSHGLVRPAFSGYSCFVHAKYVDLYQA